jgi:8-oxo-dGTP pyrophosphatase MutT (NUDIX family)
MPIRDDRGNVLVDVRFGTEAALDGLAVPASLVVVSHAAMVLMLHHSWRKEWELPGGKREPGETPHQTAVRELGEETGIHGVRLSFAAVAEFDLAEPRRREFFAIYRGQLPEVPQLTVNKEALAFRWWSSAEPASTDMSPLDAETARRVFTVGGVSSRPTNRSVDHR